MSIPFSLRSLVKDLYRDCEDGQALVKDEASPEGVVPGDAGGGGSTPQPLDVGDSPTFVDLTLTGVGQSAGWGIGTAGVVGQLVIGGVGSLMADPVDTGLAVSPTQVRFYSEFVDASNYSRISIDAGTILAEGRGGGRNSNLGLSAKGTDGAIYFMNGDGGFNFLWNINGDSFGSLSPNGDYDIGASGARVRAGYFGTGGIDSTGPVSASGYTGASLTRDAGDLTLSTTTSGAMALDSAGEVNITAQGGFTFLFGGAGGITVDAGGGQSASMTLTPTVGNGAIFFTAGNKEMDFDSDGLLTVPGSVSAPSFTASGVVKGSLQTNANATTGLLAGALAALTNATIVITDGSGQAYRIPCII